MKRKVKSMNLLSGEEENRGWAIYARIKPNGEVMANQINLINKPYSHRKYRSTKGDNHKLFILRRLTYV